MLVKILDETNKEIMLEIKNSQTEMKGLKLSVEDLRSSYDSLRTDHDVITKEIKVLKEFYQDNITLTNRGKIISTKGVIEKSYKSKDGHMKKGTETNNGRRTLV